MRTLVVNLCLILVVSATPVAAEPLTNLFVFGGPLEDIGNYASVFGDLPEPFYQNRFSNGPLAVDLLAVRFGVTMQPSLHRVGPAQGNNFASADAFAAGDQPQDLAGQVTAYLEPRGNTADPGALYYIIIGGNEVIAATYEPDNAVATQIVANAVRAKETAIHRLVAAGAKMILAPNFINIGVTPQIRLAGLSERGSKISKLHNALFAQMLNRVERELDFHLIRHDFGQFVDDTLKTADVLRFTNTTDSCLALLPTGQCDFEQFTFFNDLFPTAKVHDLWGNALLSTIVQSLAGCDGQIAHQKCPHR
jgi:phospholipase/lecithinase/hemolysin